MSSYFYFSNLPNISNLEAHVAELSLDQYMDTSIAHTLKSKCRELARADGGLLVAPTPEAVHNRFGQQVKVATVWIVAQSNVLTMPGKIQDKLLELNLELKQRVKLSHGLLQTCFTFTVIARLAPKWNMITTWLVQGSDFFTLYKAPAINFEVSVNATEITLNLNVQKLSFDFLKVEDLGLTPVITDKFKKNLNYVITEKSISTNRCVVLPNLKTAYVYSVSHHMPDNKFKTYDNLRLHWKKQHGIMLPEVQVVFYEVFFAANSRKLFSYPGSCVLKCSPNVYPERDTDVIAASFIADIHARMSNVCNKKMHFSTRSLASLVQLQSSLVAHSSQHFNELPPVKLGEEHSQVKVPSNKENQCHSNRLSSKSKISAASVKNDGVNTCKTGYQQASSFSQARTYGSNVVSVLKPSVKTGSIDKSQVSIVSSIRSLKSQSESSIKQSGTNGDMHSQRLPLAKKRCLETVSVSKKPEGPNTNKHFQNLLSPQVDLRATTSSATGDFSHEATLPTSSAQEYGKTDQRELLYSQAADLNFNEELRHKATWSVSPAKEYNKGVTEDIMKVIGKSKVADLKKWMQERGLKYHSREKKEDLISMIAIHINKTGSSYP